MIEGYRSSATNVPICNDCQYKVRQRTAKSNNEATENHKNVTKTWGLERERDAVRKASRGRTVEKKCTKDPRKGSSVRCRQQRCVESKHQDNGENKRKAIISQIPEKTRQPVGGRFDTRNRLEMLRFRLTLRDDEGRERSRNKRL